jgi:site-specific recombinase XerD
MGAIKEKMKRAMEIRGLSPRTQEHYLSCIKQFVKYFMKSPDQLSLDDIHTYQVHLIRDKKAAENTFNQYVSALKFLYGQTLKRDWKIDMIPYHKRSKRLPVVLNREEVVRMYKAVRYLKHRAMILTLYSTGIRASELANVKVSDIDSKRMLIRIDQGKNRKDRYVRLPAKLLEILRGYWRREKVKSTIWLFPGRPRTEPMNRNSIRQMVHQAKEAAGIQKQVTTHTLRHSFATHMLEDGVDIRKIQLMLGHRSLRTTAKYLHVASNYLEETSNPLDTLDLE